MAFFRALWAALLFYTILPLPASPSLSFSGIALYAPLVGVILAGLVGLGDGLLEGILPFHSVLRSALVVVGWLGLTGGLHLDGVMDTADGLAVTDRSRQLEVMSDSRSGAFGVMAALIILLLKTAALSEISTHRFSVLLHVMAWGRWGQLFAIVQYRYLRAEGKGKLHQATIEPRGMLIMGLGLLCLIPLAWDLRYFIPLCAGIAWGTGFWLNRQLGGHTGDTYGTIVEVTEALGLVLAALMIRCT